MATANATAVWEVRPTAGNDNNGGGFDPGISGAGTDYSQQNTAQLSLSDITISGSAVSSVTGGFTSAMIGNAFQINGNWYFITAVTDSHHCTITTPSTNGSGLSGNVGGALATPGKAGALMSGGNTVWIKNSGTASITSASTNVAGGCLAPPAGTTTALTRIIGYNSSRGDNGTAPLLQASGITTFTLIKPAGACHIENLTLDGGSLTSSRGIDTNSQAARVYRCTVKNFTNGGIWGTQDSLAVLCAATGCSGNSPFANGGIWEACVAYSNSITGFQCQTGMSVWINCVSLNNTSSGHGFLAGSGAAAATARNCTAYGNAGDGFRVNSAVGLATFDNCIAEANSGYGFNASANDANILLILCGGYNNTSGLGNSTITTSSIGLISATAEIFNNAGGNDFSLNTSTNGGALFRAAGLPGNAAPYLLPGISTNAYPDCGAAQHKDSGGGGTVGWVTIG
ncbi:MAG TPA: hypothetical protein VKT32_01420 [Chthonomonadaceae bacterium]|nr:hypothetical protein [Chthonomonadaceae bacterium]